MTKTYAVKPNEVKREWYVLDANGIPLGRVASKAASLLRGKGKVCYTPHVDCGDFVVVVNCSDVLMTGNKLTQKYYRKHTGYIGHLRETRCDKLLAERPTDVMLHAVRGMMPRNSLGRGAVKRLKLYADGSHAHKSQNPKKLDLV